MKLCSSDNQYTMAIVITLHIFLEILQRYCELIVLGTLGMPGYTMYSKQVCNITPMLFWRYCKDMQTAYIGHFGYAWLHRPKMIVSTCKTSIFICMPKINFTIHFFHEILHFKEYCDLTGWQHFNPKLKNQNFARHGIGSEISTTILVSILDYFQEKLMANFSNVFVFLGHFGSFLPNYGKK